MNTFFNYPIILKLVSCFLPFQQVVTILSLVNTNFQKQIQKKDFHNLRTELSFSFNFYDIRKYSCSQKTFKTYKEYSCLNKTFNDLCFIINNITKKVSLKIDNVINIKNQEKSFFRDLLNEWSEQHPLIIHIVCQISENESSIYKGGYSNTRYNGYGIYTRINEESSYRRDDNYSKSRREGYFNDDQLNGICYVSKHTHRCVSSYLGYYENNQKTRFCIQEDVDDLRNAFYLYKGNFVNNEGDCIEETPNYKKISYKNNSVIIDKIKLKNIKNVKVDVTTILDKLQDASFETKISKFNEIYEEYKREIDITSLASIKITEQMYNDNIALCMANIEKLQINHEDDIKQKLLELEQLKNNFVLTNKENLAYLEELKLEYKTNISNRLKKIT
jgi:hypothetical protein